MARPNPGWAGSAAAKAARTRRPKRRYPATPAGYLLFKRGPSVPRGQPARAGGAATFFFVTRVLRAAASARPRGAAAAASRRPPPSGGGALELTQGLEQLRGHGQRAPHHDGLAPEGVEADAHLVEKESRAELAVLLQQGRAPEIAAVGDHRMTNVRHVDADLVRPPRNEPQVQEAVGVPLGARVLAQALVDGDGVAAARVHAADGLRGVEGVVDGSAALAALSRPEGAVHQGDEVLDHVPRAELGASPLEARPGLADEHQAAGLQVESVHEAALLRRVAAELDRGPVAQHQVLLDGRRADLRLELEEGVAALLQGQRRGRGVHAGRRADPARGLQDHGDVRVLEEHLPERRQEEDAGGCKSSAAAPSSAGAAAPIEGLRAQPACP